tara:strand:- start:4355 stop:5137 length:783 start_codon:yes stop_codon:yes gene_type:complete
MPKNGQDKWFNAQHEVLPADKRKDHKTKDHPMYHDLSDSKALVGKHIIDFYSQKNRNAIAFKAFVTEFSTTWEAQFEEGGDLPFVRGDIDLYKSTKRVINLSWKTVAASEAEAKENMMRCTELVKMAYRRGSSEDQAMILKVRFANFIVNPNATKHETPGAFSPAKTSGLWCRVDNISFTPDFDQGSFDTKEGVFPIVINLSTTLRERGDEFYQVHHLYPFGQQGLIGEHIPVQGPGDLENKEDYDMAVGILLHLGGGDH